jgi:hypothetical protein
MDCRMASIPGRRLSRRINPKTCGPCLDPNFLLASGVPLTLKIWNDRWRIQSLIQVSFFPQFRNQQLHLPPASNLKQWPAGSTTPTWPASVMANPVIVTASLQFLPTTPYFHTLTMEPHKLSVNQLLSETHVDHVPDPLVVHFPNFKDPPLSLASSAVCAQVDVLIRGANSTTRVK